MSPNHKVFVAVTVHMEQCGKPVLFILDVVEVAMVSPYVFASYVPLDCMVQAHSGINLASAFAQILDEYGISSKVCTHYISSQMGKMYHFASVSASHVTMHLTMTP